MPTKNKKIRSLFLLLSLMVMSFPAIVSAKAPKVWCGNDSQGLKGSYAVPAKLPELTSFGIQVLEVVVPILLIIFGSIDLIKAISSGKEDDMKKAQSTLIKRAIAAVIVFFIFVIVKLLIGVVAGNSSAGIIDCLNCFVNNNGSCHKV